MGICSSVPVRTLWRRASTLLALLWQNYATIWHFGSRNGKTGM